MAMSDSMTTEELLSVGFKLDKEDATVANHERFKSWRYKCEKCGKWHKEREGNECPGCHQMEKLKSKVAR